MTIKCVIKIVDPHQYRFKDEKSQVRYNKEIAIDKLNISMYK